MTNRNITFAGKTYVERGIMFQPGQIPLTTLSGPELLSLYNLVASNLGRGSVKRFADTATGAKRTWKLLCEWADQPTGDFEMSEEELAGQKGRQVNREDVANPSVTVEPKVQLSDADHAQIADEAKSREPSPNDVAERLMKVASAGAVKAQAQAALRASPPASDNPAKDAEMPALRRALKPLALAPKKTVYPRKADSKQALLIDLLSRPQGVTFGELYDALAATGKPWQGVTIRSGLAWDVNNIAGYGVTSELFNGEQFAAQGRDYEAARLGLVRQAVGNDGWDQGDGYDSELKLAVYRLVYPKGMTEPLPHVVSKKG